MPPDLLEVLQELPHDEGRGYIDISGDRKMNACRSALKPGLQS